MLAHLSLKHFAVVSEAELAFGPGLTVISGETGAGKSLLVDALGLLSGLRADSGVVRHGAERADRHHDNTGQPGRPLQPFAHDAIIQFRGWPSIRGFRDEAAPRRSAAISPGRAIRDLRQGQPRVAK